MNRNRVNGIAATEIINDLRSRRVVLESYDVNKLVEPYAKKYQINASRLRASVIYKWGKRA